MPTVLCIDDHEDGLSVRKIFLEAQGYTTLVANSGPTGLSLLRLNAVDVLIVDYRMPGMNGEEVALEARRLHPELPIIMLSGYLSEKLAGREQIIDVWLVKGSSPTELLHTLEKLTGGPGTKKAQAPQSILQTSQAVARRSRQQLTTNAEHVRRIRGWKAKGS